MTPNLSPLMYYTTWVPLPQMTELSKAYSLLSPRHTFLPSQPDVHVRPVTAQGR